MLFVMLTLSFAVAILVAGGLALYIMMQPKVLKWYTKKVFTMMSNYEKVLEEIEKEL